MAMSETTKDISAVSVHARCCTSMVLGYYSVVLSYGTSCSVITRLMSSCLVTAKQLLMCTWA